VARRPRNGDEFSLSIEEQRILGLVECADRPRSHRKGLMNTQARVDRVKDLYRLNFGMFPTHMESIALDYCESYGSAAMAYVRLVSEQDFRGLLAYVRRQQRFADLDERDCELIERLFREGTNQSALMDALDELRAERERGAASEALCAM
jgi:hypothetical protein